MAYGITTSRAHLTATDPLWPEAGEIDWDRLTTWLSPTDLPPPPAFAGRYFVGWATQTEVDAGTGFCLWGHGEARGHGEGQVHVLARMNGDISTPPAQLRIVPLQRADPDRQQATGDEGLWFGYKDATALAQYVNKCLAVGDLELVDTKQVLCFLEVSDGTALSVDYWASWATALREGLLIPKGADQDLLQPFMPAMLCAFAFDSDTEKFLPESSVRACLDKEGPPGFRTQCHGLWARRLAGDAPLAAAQSFEWANLAEYRQPQRIAGLELPYMRRVPVRYLRSFDSPDGWDISDQATRETLSLVTIDQPAITGDDDALGATLRATDWAADRTDESGALAEMPTQFGIDTGATIPDTSAGCLASKDVVVTSLSYHAEGTPVNMRGPCRIALRYYRPSGNRLSLAECQALSRNDIQVVATWQHLATLTGWEAYVNDLIEPFVNHEGETDGETAFKYAAETIGQPPYTPIYFSIDFPVGSPGYTNNLPGSVPVATPGLDTILEYFRDLRRGYRRYLAAHPDRPYYVGVYAYGQTCADLYRAGLVSHCWQPPWYGTPFTHLNVWQIGMFSNANVAADNAALQTCRPAGSDPDEFWVDIDVAWGDPGGFQVIS